MAADDQDLPVYGDETRLSYWQLKRYRKARYGVLDPASQIHPTGVHGSGSELPDGTRQREMAMVELRGERSRLPNRDHLIAALWVRGQLPFEPVREQLLRPIGIFRTASLVAAHLETASGEEFVDDCAVKGCSSNERRRQALIQLIRDRLDRHDGILQSVLTIFIQVAIGVRPIWGDCSEPPLEVSLIKVLGMAPKCCEDDLGDEPRFRCDPATLKQTFALITRLGGMVGLVGRVTSGKAGLTPDDVALGREVMDTFVTGAAPIMRAALFYFGSDAFLPGSAYSMFAVFGLLDMRKRRFALLAASLSLCLAVLIREMRSRQMTEQDVVEKLVAAVRDLAEKSRAYMAVVDGVPDEYRGYFGRGGRTRRETLPVPEQQRIAEVVNAFLDSHPAEKAALLVV